MFTQLRASFSFNHLIKKALNTTDPKEHFQLLNQILANPLLIAQSHSFSRNQAMQGLHPLVYLLMKANAIAISDPTRQMVIEQAGQYFDRDDIKSLWTILPDNLRIQMLQKSPVDLPLLADLLKHLASTISREDLLACVRQATKHTFPQKTPSRLEQYIRKLFESLPMEYYLPVIACIRDAYLDIKATSDKKFDFETAKKVLNKLELYYFEVQRNISAADMQLLKNAHLLDVYREFIEDEGLSNLQQKNPPLIKSYRDEADAMYQLALQHQGHDTYGYAKRLLDAVTALQMALVPGEHKAEEEVLAPIANVASEAEAPLLVSANPSGKFSRSAYGATAHSTKPDFSGKFLVKSMF